MGANFIKAVNGLTLRWTERWDGAGSAVVSALGAWPLLALLADAAEGPARAQLAEAVGLPPEEALDAAHGLLRLLHGRSGLGLALGLWTGADVAVSPDWAGRLPDPATHSVLDTDPDQAREALDAWVDKQTGGVLHEFPADAAVEAPLLLAGAVTVSTRWKRDFTPGLLVPEAGPWAGRRLRSLSRECDPAEVRVVRTQGTEITLKTVPGLFGTNVIMALGEPGRGPAEVLHGTALAACADDFLHAHPVDLGLERPGPGLTVSERPAQEAGTTAELLTVGFTVSSRHDLLADRELFGLGAAADPALARFPALGDPAPHLGAAVQTATAAFSATGFLAAPADPAEPPRVAVPRREHTAKHLDIRFDRPFGFLTVDRPTGLIMACGWVAEPEAYPEAFPEAVVEG